MNKLSKVRKTIEFPSEEGYNIIKSAAARHGLTIGEFLQEMFHFNTFLLIGTDVSFVDYLRGHKIKDPERFKEYVKKLIARLAIRQKYTKDVEDLIKKVKI